LWETGRIRKSDMTEREKMLAGEVCCAVDSQLIADLQATREV